MPSICECGRPSRGVVGAIGSASYVIPAHDCSGCSYGHCGLGRRAREAAPPLWDPREEGATVRPGQ